jgi:hypothetical protein
VELDAGVELDAAEWRAAPLEKAAPLSLHWRSREVNRRGQERRVRRMARWRGRTVGDGAGALWGERERERERERMVASQVRWTVPRRRGHVGACRGGADAKVR